MNKYFFSLFLFFSLTSHTRVHIIGDSHAKFCFDSGSCYDPEYPILDFLKVHWLGPITMHRVGRDGLAFLNLKNLKVRENDVVVFVFGEIDVRCHIGRIRDRDNKSEKEIITDLVQRYFTTILLNKNLFQNLKILVCTVIPPSDLIYNKNFPFYGDLEDRISLTIKLNNTIKNIGINNIATILDIYNPFVDSEGKLEKKYSDGNIHIASSNNSLFRKKLAKLINLPN